MESAMLYLLSAVVVSFSTVSFLEINLFSLDFLESRHWCKLLQHDGGKKVARVQNWYLGQAAPDLVGRLIDEVMPSSQQACVLGGLLCDSISYNKDRTSHPPQFHCHFCSSIYLRKTTAQLHQKYTQKHCVAVQCKHKDVPHKISDQVLITESWTCSNAPKPQADPAKEAQQIQQGNDIEWYWMIDVSQRIVWFAIIIQDQVYP